MKCARSSSRCSLCGQGLHLFGAKVLYICHQKGQMRSASLDSMGGIFYLRRAAMRNALLYPPTTPAIALGLMLSPRPSRSACERARNSAIYTKIVLAMRHSAGAPPPQRDRRPMPPRTPYCHDTFLRRSAVLDEHGKVHDRSGSCKSHAIQKLDHVGERE